MTEGLKIEYGIHLDKPPTIGSKSVSVEVSILTETNESLPSLCHISQGGDESLVFTEANFNVPQPVTVTVADDGMWTAKDTVARTCVVSHVDISGEFAQNRLEVHPVSIGCGLGEYFGDDYSRGPSGTRCVCGIGHFFRVDAPR